MLPNDNSQLELFGPSGDALVVADEIQKLKRNYDSDDAQSIFGMPLETKQQTEAARKKLIAWIKNPKEQVKVIIAFSGGKDSIAMVLHCLFDLKIPKEQIELWHHEIDGGGEQLFDWACTPSYCQAFADGFGVKLLFSYAEGGIVREIFRKDEFRQPVFFQSVPGGDYTELKPRGFDKDKNTRMMFPAVQGDLRKRWCSSVAKIDVMAKSINNDPRFDNASIAILTGERRDESNIRALYNEIEPSSNTTQSRRAVAWRPIIDWTQPQVWEIMKKHKVQPHPCYELGWSRCSCQLCIFSSKNTWASINDISPEKVERIANIEKEIGHTLYNEWEKEQRVNPDTGRMKGFPIRKLDIYEARVNKGVSFIEKERRDKWLIQALTKFTMPIFVSGEWQTPPGARNLERTGAN